MVEREVGRVDNVKILQWRAGVKGMEGLKKGWGEQRGRLDTDGGQDVGWSVARGMEGGYQGGEGIDGRIRFFFW